MGAREESLTEREPPGRFAAATEDAYYVRDLQQLHTEAAAWARAVRVGPARESALRVLLLITDQQHGFAASDGTLFVAGEDGRGALDDNGRLAQFLLRNAAFVTDVVFTLDSHREVQVFHAAAHVRRDGTPPDPFTVITAEQYRAGEYEPSQSMVDVVGRPREWVRQQFVHYCQELERTGRSPLTIWPYHCLIGHAGHRLAGQVDEAVRFFGFARQVQPVPVLKGDNPLTEHYSVLRPEVTTLFDGSPIPGAMLNEPLVQQVLAADVVAIAGEAASHCVAWSVQDLLTELRARDPSRINRLHLLTDCTSSVTGFAEQGRAALEEFAAAGMHLVRSTDPVSEWPGLPWK
jgi:nicotinamidase-related amidase